MSKYFYLLGFIIVLGSCKTQKVSTTKKQPSSDSTQVTLSIPDTIPTTPTELPVLDTVALQVHRLLPDTIRIKAVGDMMLGTNFPDPSYLPPNEGRDMLSSVATELSGADILFGNLEGVILNEGGTPKHCNNPKTCYLFRSPEYMVTRLQETGFNLLSVANNHSGDFGNEGRANTARVLDSLGIWYAGNEVQPYTIFKHQGIVYGFAAFAPNKGTPSINDIPAARQTVSLLDSLVDVIIISFHGGAEGAKYTHVPKAHEYFYGEDRGDVYEFAHALIDAGADVIFGHGPHVPRAIEIYKERFIAYSLGNFATYRRFNLKGDNGMAPIAAVEIDAKGVFLSGRLIAAKQVGSGVPMPDPTMSSTDLIRELTKKDFAEIGLNIEESGEIVYIHR